MSIIFPTDPSSDPDARRIKLTLAEFLLERIAEDEVVAREMFPDRPITRALGDYEARRRIVALHSEVDGRCDTCSIYGTGVQDNEDCCPTLRTLGAVYAEREGYREEWRP